MYIATAPSRIDVIVHSEPAEWWQIVAAFTPPAVLLGITAAIVWYAVRRPVPDSVAVEETQADCWNRIEWALDMAFDQKPERRKVGVAVLEQLSTSPSVGKEDAQILAQARALLSR